MNEIDAVKAFKNGDKKAFKYLFELYYDRLVAYIVTYTHDKMSSEDIVQQAFVNLWKDRGKLDEIRSPKNYLYAIAYNRYIDSVTKEKRKTKLFDVVYERALRDRIEEDREVLDKRIEKMNSIISTLPPRCQEILKMNKVQGFRYKDIAETLGISVKTVESQMGIAFKKIRKAFEDDKLILLLLRNVTM
ncbi:RNA polymerase sigma-70 factor [Flavivirga abyssicola]|uniref:RNA polymerase sigma factor n=1 Tax=Flavivirga abyssicola TaxID=3063533 RepID=UPI0026DFBBB5|nr:RNA polymerase sigma-70 factor [Flavivirga sp. MEBiC07777]WVK12011.1 RNA polymerase sigma-70 factor [Flavivirga sp. MEBiC07777]